MKKKTSSKKSVSSKKKPVRKAKAPKVETVIRQVAGLQAKPGTKHLVRVINNCSTSTLVFSTTEELNEFLFQWEIEHHGEDPMHSGSWIDLIVTGIEGEVVDLEHLESL